MDYFMDDEQALRLPPSPSEWEAMKAENAKLRAEVEFQASLYRDAAAARDKHWKALQASDLQVGELREALKGLLEDMKGSPTGVCIIAAKRARAALSEVTDKQVEPLGHCPQCHWIHEPHGYCYGV